MRATLRRSEAEHASTLQLTGDVVLDDAADLYSELRRIATGGEFGNLALDFSHAGRLDSAGAVAATLGARLFEARGRSCEFTGLREQHTQALALVSEQRQPVHDAAAAQAWPAAWLERLRRGRGLIAVAELVVDTVSSGVRCLVRYDRRRLLAVAEQTVVLGVDATFIVSLLSFLVGVILAFQGAFQLGKFGASVYMAELVSLGMVREFAPIITAIILAGRSGAAIAAEIGTMAVNDEVEALRAMGISRAQYLVFPRVAAMTLAQPLLTLLSMAVGIAAGVAMGSVLGIPMAVSLQRMQDALVLDDFVLGVIKSLLFAWIIAFVGCWMGLSTQGGAQSVGRNTTLAVVFAIFWIVVTDSAVTTTWTLSHGRDAF